MGYVSFREGTLFFFPTTKKAVKMSRPGPVPVQNPGNTWMAFTSIPTWQVFGKVGTPRKTPVPPGQMPTCPKGILDKLWPIPEKDMLWSRVGPRSA